MASTRLAAFLAAALACSSARAAVSSGGFELVYSYPEETTLSEPDLRQTADVWPELFDAARRSIDVEHFYVTPSTAEPLDPVLEPSLRALERAGKRGVRIRVLLERKFARNSIPGVERLVAIPNLELRFIDWSKVGLTGKGIVHAKFFVVDSTAAFVGSANFDWRAMDQIHELGLAITDPRVAGQAQAVFDKDWAMAGAVDWAIPGRAAPQPADASAGAYLVASPWRYDPDGVGDSQAELVRLIAAARREIWAQTYDYLPEGFGRGAAPYRVIDDALRAALARKVKVRLLVDRLNEDKRHLPFLKSLAQAGAEIRFVELPEAKRGHIDYARVIHSKYMVVDGGLLWLGTSNWAGGYLDDSRNLEVVLKDRALAARVRALHRHLWSSPYATPLDRLK